MSGNTNNTCWNAPSRCIAVISEETDQLLEMLLSEHHCQIKDKGIQFMQIKSCKTKKLMSRSI